MGDADLKVVPINPDGKPHLFNLNEAILCLIDDILQQSNKPVTKAEIVGTLEFVKQEVMNRE
jgi:hypothetical protein